MNDRGSRQSPGAAYSGDRIRDELAAMGIQLKDTKNKDTGEIETTWEVRR